MNFIDLLLVVIVLLAAWAGWAKGFINGFASLLIWLGSLASGFLLYKTAGDFLLRIVPSITIWAQPLAFVLTILLSRILLSTISYRLLRFSPKEVQQSVANRAFSILPGLVTGSVYAAIAATLLLSVPINNGVTKETQRSKIANQLNGQIAWLDEKFSPVFGDAAKQTLSRFVKEPESDETVYLHYSTTDVQPRSDLEQQMLALVNEERIRRGISPLKFDPQLVPVARAHSTDMFARGYFSHYTLTGKDPFERMKSAGIKFTTAGENLALGRTLKICHEGLMNSPGHKANILNPAFGRMGIGIIDGGIYGLMISQEFRN